MGSDLQSPNSPFQRCVGLLRRLHEMMSAGEGETDAADGLREQLADLWTLLGSGEQDLLQGLSVDLYTLGGNEPPLPPGVHASERSLERLAPRIKSAYEHQDWTQLLALCRLHPEFVPKDRRAYLRARCWQSLGHPDLAVLFFDDASRLNPANVNYPAFTLEALIQSGQITVALQRASDFIAREETHPRLLFRAADVLFRWGLTLPASEAAPIFERVIGIIHRSLARERALPENELLKSVTVAAFIELALCQLRLNRPQEARQAYFAAHEIDPDNSRVLAACGLLALKESEAEALPFFRAAVQKGCPLVLPYYFLANRALMGGDYLECFRLADLGLEHATRPEIMADLLEWSAIARFELGANPAEVRRLFEAALLQAPTSERIARNLATFEHHVRRAVSKRLEWAPVSAEDIPVAAQEEVLQPQELPRAA